MKIGLLQEGEVMAGVSYAQRYEEMIREVTLADKVGFHSWGTSEQHFAPPRFTVSAPEVLYAAIARHTDNIKLRIMCAVLLKWNHPILVAERLATLDIVSNGRAELATARSNNLTTLGAFGVDPEETAAQWADSMDVIAKALTQEKLSHDGPFWKIPEVELVPRCLKEPPISVAASSTKSHFGAGERGIGALCFESYFGFDYMQDCIDAYRDGFKVKKDSLTQTNENMGLYVASAYCAKDREEAIEAAKDVMLGYFHFILDLYAPLGKAVSYEYLDQRIKPLIENRDNEGFIVDYLLNNTPSVMVGTPDDFITRLKDLEQRGVDEVLLRIDGMNHDLIMNSIELIGAEVIPHFSSRSESGE